jgi:hypothetical protein
MTISREEFDALVDSIIEAKAAMKSLLVDRAPEHFEEYEELRGFISKNANNVLSSTAVYRPDDLSTADATEQWRQTKREIDAIRTWARVDSRREW